MRTTLREYLVELLLLFSLLTGSIRALEGVNVCIPGHGKGVCTLIPEPFTP